ncbi:hypothetical protein Ocin01_07649 [Orchesella cincta]|uniref:Uncharacterized protein n=1 Tax=Orchesella cincta TaxID=48709 RepID=A0A1D2N175_ORCCI|nr:hypothetical protein Ocin01_07649 [Orchesella cincta]
MQNNDGLLDEETVTGGATRNDSTIIQASRPPRSRVRRRVSRSPRSRVRRRVRTPSTITSVFRRTPSSIARAPVSTLNLTDLHQFRENLTTGYLGEALIQSFLDREVQANNDGLLDENTVTGGATRNDSTIIQASRPPGSRVRRTVPTPSTITSLFRRTPSSLARTLFSTHNLTDLYPLSRNLAAGHLGEALIQSFQEREVEVLLPSCLNILVRSSGFDEPLLPKKIRKKKKRIQLEDPPETERDMEWLCYTGSETDTEALVIMIVTLAIWIEISQVDFAGWEKPQPKDKQQAPLAEVK